ncbi:MAG: thiol-disulfide oxidoreductase DCC family protein [Planctomycetaceae bacterium]
MHTFSLRDTMNGSLPDPDDHPQTDVVIYDGECNFCKAQVSRLRMLDRWGHRLSYLSLHDPRVAERYPHLTHAQLMEQMYVVDRSGRAMGGSDAVRYLSRRMPLLWPLMPILHLPGTAALWRWGYQQIAKRRYLLGGRSQECAEDACSVHLNR